MASPSPNSSPSAVPPASTTRSPPPASTPTSPPPASTTTSPPPASTASALPPSPSTTSSPPTDSMANATSDPPAPATPSTPSPPPPGSPPPVVPAPPPPVSVSPPTPAPPLSPPVTPTPPRMTPPPPSPPRAPPPDAASPPPPPVSAVPPAASPPPPRAVSPTPPQAASPPPPRAVSPTPPQAASPPPPRAASPSPPAPFVDPPLGNVPSPLSSNSPPPPSTKPPESSPSPPTATPPTPSGSQAASPSSPPPPSDQPQPVPPPPVLPSPPFPVQPSPSIPSDDPPPILPNPDPNRPPFDNSKGNGIGTGGAVAIGVVVGFVALSLIGMAVWCMRKQKKKATGYNGGYVMPSPLGSSHMSDSSHIKSNSSAPLVGNGSGSDFINSPSEPGGLGNSRSWFTYEELVEITNGFSPQNLLGEGGFGSVYKGCLADGREVAVKQLKIGSAQGEREFKAEVEIISRVHHRHLVSLVGYCISEHQRLLVYEYVPNMTLHYHLHGEGRPVMDWATRVKVAAGAAHGIAYLHEDCHPRIIHRDIKSSNILLDNNFEARVSDFGLAKLALDSFTHVTTRVMGTFGYMAPEYASSGKLTEKSDVYSFGVVLLELITGRKPVDASQPLGDESLVEWARPLLNEALDSEDFEGLADPRLEKNYAEHEMFRMIEAAAACVRHSALKRPRMGQVVRALDDMGVSSDLTNGMKPGQSEVFDSAQQSAEIRIFQRMAFGSQEYSTEYFSQNT